jgi:thiamine pyrophosphate-dependent acetolactate synthase large subunit-like protein
VNLQAYWREQQISEHDFPLSVDLSKPVMRFDEMARSIPVPGMRVEKPEEMAPAIRQTLAHQGPILVDVVLEGNVHPEMIGVRRGQ